MSLRPTVLGAVAAAVAAAPAGAEIHFLAKQYTRCTACHYAESGGTLLTAYGRSLSREELSSFGKSSGDLLGTEHEALFGAVRAAIEDVPILEGLDLGVAVRPSRLEFDAGRGKIKRDLWMKADLQAAYQRGGWTAYGEVGRYPSEPAEFISREHWLSFTAGSGTGFRVGRFLPAFGLRHLDHTSLNRRDLGFGEDDQIYGVELSQTGDKSLVQFALGPGRAESLLDDDGLANFTVTGRVQRDLSNRQVLALSGLYRAGNDRVERHAIGSVAYGIAPSERLSVWAELDARVQEGWKGTPEYTVFSEVSFEAVRGIWLKFSPQLRTELANVSGGATRYAFGVQLFPRTHWNLNVSWIRDRDRLSGFTFKTSVVQLHLYL